jgi:tetratricopeptide (TPR) repeat protein
VPDNAPKQEYTRADVRRMLGTNEAQLRRWERQGFIPSRNVFTFSDLIAIRTIKKLRENGIPPRRIGRALESLKQKGISQPLSELKLVSNGGAIAVQIAGERMEAITGQLLFNFDAASGSVKTLPSRTAPDARMRAAESEAWFQKGLALEETGAPPEQAIEAYRKAVELNPSAAGALVNLGTIQYRMRRFKEAEQFYQRALAVDAQYALAHFNLGNLYDETGNTAAAQEHYGRALDLNPNYADAHFNLALLSEKTGDPLGAVRHWKAYLKLDSTTAWAEIARRQLTRLRDATIIRNSS